MARIRDWAGAVGEVAQSGPLRRAQASFGAMWASETAFMIGLAVVATIEQTLFRPAHSALLPALCTSPGS